MARLHPTLTFGADESPTSFVSRLAWLHGAGSARRLCGDLALDFQGIVDGRHEALSALSQVSGASLNSLLRNAIFRGANGRYYFRGERLLKSSLRREHLHVCPSCLKEDIAASGLHPGASVQGRPSWQLAAIRTCPIHRRTLVEAASSNTPI